jgi:hypothetical protein
VPSGGSTPGWLQSINRFIVHDALPVVAGVGAFAGCEFLTGGSGSPLCVAAGFAAYGYVHHAVETHTAFSIGNLKAGVDTGAFAGCVVATALACAGLSVAATGWDYYAAGHASNQWGGRTAVNAAIGLGFDFADYRAGKYFEDAARTLESGSQVTGAALSTAGGPAISAGGGARALISANNAARGVSQASLDNLIRVANWDYGTATCTNPAQIPSYCP